MMRVGILGPVEVTRDEDRLSIDTAKERAVICVLALRAGSVVPRDVLVDALWGDNPPPTADRTLGTHVSRLRGLIGAEMIQGNSRGYLLDIEPAHVDSHRLTSLIDEASAALAAGRPDLGAEIAREAVELWRGDPLDDLADGAIRQGEKARLEELRFLAVERTVEARLMLGQHDRLVGELESLVARYPLREALWGDLMLALYRSGRQADALRTFARLRRTLRDELGLEPMPSSTRIESLILHQDPQLDLVPPPPPTNLPAAPSSFIGRVDDIRRISKTLGEHRLVTLVGPGGVGKTRLALQVAGDLVTSFRDGVWWVDLAPVSDPGAITIRLASELDVTASPGGSIESAVQEFLGQREMLLVIDNCEHLADSVAALIGRMLEAGPGIAVLATSRIRLAIPGELRYQVAPMSTPAPGTSDPTLLEFDAVRLFSERAAESSGSLSGTDLGSIAEICRRLEGLPLAIELVAAQMTSLTPVELLARLGSRLDAVTGLPHPPVDGHGPLRATLDRSRELLGPHAQNLLARLTVFPASFDLDAVEAVGVGAGCSRSEVDDALGCLVDASMVDPVSTSGPVRRFRLLATVREYAAEWLDEAAELDACRRHSTHFRYLARALGTEVDGPHAADALGRLRRDDANLRAAIAWSLTHDDRATSLDFGRAVGRAWFVWGDLAGCIRLIETLLDGADRADAATRGWTTYQLVWPALLLGDGERAWAALDRAMELADESGDAQLAGSVLMARGHSMLLGLGDTDAAVPLYEQAIDACGSTELSAARIDAQLGMAQALVLADRSEGVVEMLDEVQPILSSVVDDNRLAHAYLDRALLAWCVGDTTTIPDLAATGCRHARVARNTYWEQINVVALGAGHLLAGDLDEAETEVLRAARMALDDGNLLQLGVALQMFAALSAALGDSRRAAQLFGVGTTLAPLWPLVDRGIRSYLDLARAELGDRFDIEVDLGRRLGPDDAVTLILEGPSG